MTTASLRTNPGVTNGTRLGAGNQERGELPSWSEQLHDSQDWRREDSGRHKSRGRGLPGDPFSQELWDLPCSHQIYPDIDSHSSQCGNI